MKTTEELLELIWEDIEKDEIDEQRNALIKAYSNFEEVVRYILTSTFVEPKNKKDVLIKMKELKLEIKGDE